MKKEEKIDRKVKNITKFQYFDDDFYGFLHMVSRGKTNKLVRFKNKITKTLTPEVAGIIKSFIDNSGLKYKNSQIKSLLDNHNNIQQIINTSINHKDYK